MTVRFRTSKLYVYLLVAGAIAFAAPITAQRDFSNVQIQSEKVAGSVHMLTSGIAGNIGVSVGEDGILIVDDQFAPLAPKIRAGFEALGPGDLEFVINTHWHGDHVGGNEVFGEEAVIVAHTNVRARMEKGSEGPRATPPAKQVALPEITYDDGLSIHFNGEEIRVEHLPPGHTDGDSYIYFTGSNVAHLGDDFFAGRFPFVDLASGGSVEGLAKNIAMLLEELPADVKIIPGHGPQATLDDLKTFHEMLVFSIHTVKQAKAAGKSLDDIKQAGLGDEWSGWSWGFITTDRWLEIVYNSVG